MDTNNNSNEITEMESQDQNQDQQQQQQQPQSITTTDEANTNQEYQNPPEWIELYVEYGPSDMLGQESTTQIPIEDEPQGSDVAEDGEKSNSTNNNTNNNSNNATKTVAVKSSVVCVQESESSESIKIELEDENSLLLTSLTSLVPVASGNKDVNEVTYITEIPNDETSEPPRKKQKRKEALLTRPLNKEDEELKFQIIEPIIQEVEVKRKPRKEYRTKKKVAMEKLSKDEPSNDEPSNDEPSNNKPSNNEPSDNEPKKECTEEPKREMLRRELPKRGMKEKSIEPAQKPQPKPRPKQQPKQQQPHLQPERRTRLSNQCRVATGKSYECNDCDFSTDRINNIILHVKENCPMLKKSNKVDLSEGGA